MSGLGSSGAAVVWMKKDGKPAYLDFYAAQPADSWQGHTEPAPTPRQGQEGRPGQAGVPAQGQERPQESEQEQAAPPAGPARRSACRRDSRRRGGPARAAREVREAAARARDRPCHPAGRGGIPGRADTRGVHQRRRGQDEAVPQGLRALLSRREAARRGRDRAQSRAGGVAAADRPRRAARVLRGRQRPGVDRHAERREAPGDPRRSRQLSAAVEAAAVHRLPRPCGALGRAAGERSPGAAHPRTPGAVQSQGAWASQPLGRGVRRARLGAARGAGRCTRKRRPELGPGSGQRDLLGGLRRGASSAGRQPQSAADHRAGGTPRAFDHAAPPGECRLYDPYGAAPEIPAASVERSPQPPDVVGERLDEQGGETTHLSVVDKDGNAVALTQTNSSVWGSGGFVGGTS